MPGRRRRPGRRCPWPGPKSRAVSCWCSSTRPPLVGGSVLGALPGLRFLLAVFLMTAFVAVCLGSFGLGVGRAREARGGGRGRLRGRRVAGVTAFAFALGRNRRLQLAAVDPGVVD